MGWRWPVCLTDRQSDKAVGLVLPRLSYSVRMAVLLKRIPILGIACQYLRQRQKDQEFKIILDYTACWKSAWSILIP